MEQQNLKGGKCLMDVFEKIGESVYMAGIQVKNKAKEVADIASLKAQVTTCDEVIRKNYIAIGKAFYEKNKDNPNAEFIKHITAIKNAESGKERLLGEIEARRNGLDPEAETDADPEDEQFFD